MIFFSAPERCLGHRLGPKVELRNHNNNAEEMLCTSFCPKSSIFVVLNVTSRRWSPRETNCGAHANTETNSGELERGIDKLRSVGVYLFVHATIISIQDRTCLQYVSNIRQPSLPRPPLAFSKTTHSTKAIHESTRVES